MMTTSGFYVPTNGKMTPFGLLHAERLAQARLRLFQDQGEIARQQSQQDDQVEQLSSSRKRVDKFKGKTTIQAFHGLYTNREEEAEKRVQLKDSAATSKSDMRSLNMALRPRWGTALHPVNHSRNPSALQLSRVRRPKTTESLGRRALASSQAIAPKTSTKQVSRPKPATSQQTISILVAANRLQRFARKYVISKSRAPELQACKEKELFSSNDSSTQQVTVGDECHKADLVIIRQRPKSAPLKSAHANGFSENSNIEPHTLSCGTSTKSEAALLQLAPGCKQPIEKKGSIRWSDSTGAAAVYGTQPLCFFATFRKLDLSSELDVREKMPFHTASSRGRGILKTTGKALSECKSGAARDSSPEISSFQSPNDDGVFHPASQVGRNTLKNAGTSRTLRGRSIFR